MDNGKIRFLGSLTDHGPSFAGAVFDKDFLCPTLTTMEGGGRQPMIIVCEPEEEKKDDE